jgi:hypothetical protein
VRTGEVNDFVCDKFVWLGPQDADKRLMIRIPILVWALATIIPAQATTLRRASLDDLIQTSTSIVRARVTGSFTAQQGPLLYTHYTIQVLDRWKGPLGAQVDVQVPQAIGAPQFTTGSEYVLFLWTGPSGANHVLGLTQGALDVTKDAVGNTMVVRQPTEAMVLNTGTGGTGSQDPVQMKLSDFASRVSSALGRSNTK